MKINSDVLAAAMTDFFLELLRPVPGAQVIQNGGVTAAISGAQWPSHNLVWFDRPDPAVTDVASLLDETVRCNVPFVLEARPVSDEVAKLAIARGMTADEELPLMAVNRSADVLPPPELSIRLLAPGEVQTHVLLSAESFETPEEIFRNNITEDALKNSAVRCYVGELGGKAVATGLSVTTGAFTGIMDIATDPQHRGRGFGTAITARAVADGLAAGASWCWLQSSAQGYPVYRSLGFQTIESWQCWVSLKPFCRTSSAFFPTPTANSGRAGSLRSARLPLRRPLLPARDVAD